MYKNLVRMDHRHKCKTQNYYKELRLSEDFLDIRPKAHPEENKLINWMPSKF